MAHSRRLHCGGGSLVGYSSVLKHSSPCSREFCILVALILLCVNASANSLLNPPYTVDGLKLIEGAPGLLAGAQADRIVPTTDQSAIMLDPTATAGSVMLAPTTSDFPFNEAIPSWNGTTSGASGFRVWMRCSTKAGATPWFEAGTWGKLADEPTTRVSVFPQGIYDADTLMLRTTADSVQFRIDFVRASTQTPSPTIRLVALSYSNSLGNKGLWKRFGDPRPALSPSLGQIQTTDSQKLPFRSQVIPNTKWIGRICSPASVGMAMEHFGSNISTQDIAAQLYDPPSDAFGVWHRSIQIGGQNGIRGYMTRLRNWDAVKNELNQGHVVCASIRFGYGELASPPREYRNHGTLGHIIVIEGFAPGGRVVVNNSATKDFGRNETWTQQDLARAWFDKGGAAYVFTGRVASPNAISASKMAPIKPKQN